MFISHTRSKAWCPTSASSSQRARACSPTQPPRLPVTFFVNPSCSDTLEFEMQASPAKLRLAFEARSRMWGMRAVLSEAIRCERESPCWSSCKQAAPFGRLVEMSGRLCMQGKRLASRRTPQGGNLALMLLGGGKTSDGVSGNSVLDQQLVRVPAKHSLPCVDVQIRLDATSSVSCPGLSCRRT